jgi:phospholipid N-methyltransferase
LHFLRQYLRNPRQIGAVAPSSRVLAQAMTRPEWLAQARSVVELGPGDGPVTSVLRERLAGRDHVFFALEINASMCLRLRERFPDVPVYCDSAAEMRRYLDLHGVSGADLVVSSIPWASFDLHKQKEIMSKILDCMPSGGRFVTFTYVTSLALPAGKRFRRFLEQSFGRVRLSPVVWRNLPPAVVYDCVKR